MPKKKATAAVQGRTCDEINRERKSLLGVRERLVDALKAIDERLVVTMDEFGKALKREQDRA